MTCEHAISLLDDYLDGELSPAEHARVEQHLAGCASCRDEVEGLRALVSMAGALPSLPSETVDDDWAALASRLAAPELPAAPARRPWWPVAVVALAAAALLAVRLPPPEVPVEPEPVQVVEADPAPEGLVVLEATVADLEAALEERPLSPEARARVDANLAVIDEALAEIRAALATRPDDRNLQHTLARVTLRKVDLLHDATRMAGG